MCSSTCIYLQFHICNTFRETNEIPLLCKIESGIHHIYINPRDRIDISHMHALAAAGFDTFQTKLLERERNAILLVIVPHIMLHSLRFV